VPSHAYWDELLVFCDCDIDKAISVLAITSGPLSLVAQHIGRPAIASRAPTIPKCPYGIHRIDP
jgi:hypothetical protein